MRDSKLLSFSVATFLFLGACGGGGGDSGIPTVIKATVSGTVLDSRNNPISAATVTINSTPVTAVTNPAGQFSAEVEAGDHEIIVEKSGYSVFSSGFSVPSASPVDLGSIVAIGFYPAFMDSDGDGYGDSSNATAFSTDAPPSPYVRDDTDCDDSQGTVNPGAAEVCNQTDDNCDASIDEGFDGDGDGYTTCGGDCDDTVASVFPDATEVCNGVDDNCIAGIDEGVLVTFYRDSDADGYGDPSATTDACTAPSGYVTDSTDCDDTAGTVNPGVTEVCNGVDDNCAGGIDEGVLLTFYQDWDSDTYGDPSVSLDGCNAPAGFVADNTDCDDASGVINPGATEICNGVDDNCVNGIDEGLLTIYYIDSDGDTFGDPATANGQCTQPAGHVTNGLDCDDSDAGVNPDATEVCDNVDNDCSGTADEGLLITFYQDSDADTYGNPVVTVEACTVPSGYVADGSDCDDGNSNVNPAATEICDGMDNNCVGGVDEGVLLTFYLDSDGDTYGDPLTYVDACSMPAGSYTTDPGDCDDADASVNPLAVEICDGIDNNCAGGIDEGVTTTYYLDSDADGYGNPGWSQEACSPPVNFVLDGQDCDDSDPNINPETVWYADSDADQWPTSLGPVTECGPVNGSIPGHLFSKFDCDDTTPALCPGNLEIPGNVIDDDCNPATSDSPANYGLADLAGTWTIVGVNAGDYASSQWNGWVDGTITFDSKGQYTDYTLTYDNGDTETAPSFTQLWVHPDGTITTTEAPELHGALSQDKDTIAATFTDPAGGCTLYLLQKQAMTATLADFVGLWYGAGIAGADSPGFAGWMKGSFNLQPGGMALVQTTDSQGNYEDGYVNTGLDTSGALSDPEITRYIAPDGQMVMGRGDYRGGSMVTTLIRSGGAFLPGNLSGDWSFHVLSAGDAPQINGWGHGTLHFDVSGVGTVSVQTWSDPAAVIDLGTLSLDGNGAIVSNALPDFEGHLSINKDTITATFTNDSGGGSLLIALRREPPFLGIVPEEHNSVSAVVGSAGGSLQTVSDDGVDYYLYIPPFALMDTDQEVTVKMTPLSAADGLPVSGSFLGAVQLAPDGLQLVETGALVATVPGILALTEPYPFVYEGSGDDLSFTPLLPSFLGTGTGLSSVLIPVEHFSGGGMATGQLPDMQELMTQLESEPSRQADLYRMQVSAVIREMYQGGIWDFSDPAASNIYLERIRSVLSLWFWDYIIQLTRDATTIEEIRRALLEYLRWLSMIDSLVTDFDIFCTVNQRTGVCEWTWENNQVIPGAHSTMESETDQVIDGRVSDLDNRCQESVGLISCDPVDPPSTGCPPAGETNWCAGGYYWDLVQPWLFFKVEIHGKLGWSSILLFGEGGELQAFCSGIDDQLPQLLNVVPDDVVPIDIDTMANFQGQYATYRAMRGEESSRPVTVWHSDSPSIATVSSSGEVQGVSPGITAIRGWDNNECLDDRGTVIVGDPFLGTWNIRIWSRTSETCAILPPMVRPSNVSMHLNGNELVWQDFSPGYSFLMVGNVDLTNLSNVVVSGADAQELLQYQTCDLTFTGTGFLQGTCNYRDLNNSWTGGICSGTWKFMATKELN